jgi:hypothetical protein
VFQTFDLKYFLYFSFKPKLTKMTEKITRPVFLTVLCILTFIGTSFVIVSNLIGLAMAPVVKGMTGMAESQMDQAMGEVSTDAPGFAPILQKLMGTGMAAMEHYTQIVLIKIVFAAIALFGAILMWKLKKTGFYLYSGAQVLLIASLFVILGGSGFAFLAILGTLFFSTLFIILYALNLKAMK